MKFSRRWLWLLLLLPLIAGLARLRFDVEVLNLLPGDVPAVQGLKLYQQNFANAGELILTVNAPDAETTEAAARELALALAERKSLIKQVTWQPPWLEHPGQAAELIAHLWLNQPPEVFGELTNRLAPEKLAANLAATREQLTTSMSPADIARLSYDPFGLTRLPDSATAGAPVMGQGQELFASGDGTFRIVFVQATTELTSYRECVAWLSEVKAIVDQWGGDHRTVKVHYTGRPAFVAEIAGGMERDMTSSVLGTMLIIAALFWWLHRRWKPLLWLLALLVLILAATLALGGLFIGRLNVVSLGFAAILLGLAVDYGLVLYQEWLAAPQLSVLELRREIASSIIWSAFTTAGAFLILNLSDLPGLAQLGTLVAIGVTLAALVMLYLFLPPLARDASSIEHSAFKVQRPELSGKTRKLAWQATSLLILASVIILACRRPALDHTAKPLRPLNSPAYASLEEIKSRMAQNQEPLWLLVSGKNESEVAQRLERANVALARAVSNREISSVTLPVALWPRPEHQSANRATAQTLGNQRYHLHEAALAAGFTTNSLALTDNLLDVWRLAASSTQTLWPTNAASRWVMEKFSARHGSDFIAIGLIYPTRNTSFTALNTQLHGDGILLAGWDMLGEALLGVVERDLWRVLLPMLALLLGSLWLAFRRVSEVVLSLATLLFSALCLWAIMGLLDWSWNLLNLMALPLLLGAGVDYSIHMQLALRRHDGDIAATRLTIGKALWLCGGTTIAGFGSLAWSNNAGLASLGQVCATGIGCAMLTSIYLLPVWWHKIAGASNSDSPLPERDSTSTRQPEVAPPSSLYRAGFWKLGLFAARRLPSGLFASFARFFAWGYWLVNSEKREVVIQNLLPVLNGNRAAAEQMTKKLFLQFGRKLADLWRYEAGLPVEGMFTELTGWEHFTAARAKGRGVLLLTPHLGNWEFGAPLLASRGVKLLVLTQAEPGDGFTEMRQAARARWGIETLVVGQDAFAFIEIIKRLEAGATVALLVDRPPPASAVEVEFFGRPFQASIAAAELARASGCALLPVVLLRTNRGYVAQLLPEITFERVALGNREARQLLTQKIMRAFEPAIRQHPDQWYHFVPIWPK